MMLRRIAAHASYLAPLPAISRWLWRRSGVRVASSVTVGRHVTMLAQKADIHQQAHIGDDVYIGQLHSLIIGSYTSIGLGAIIDGDADCSIGNNCFIAPYSNINVRKSVSIGDNVALGGAHVQLWTHGAWHERFGGDKLAKFAPVTIEKDAWIGTGSIILPGVVIGNSAVVGAGSVVTHDVPAHTLVSGSPARVRKTESDYRRQLEAEDLQQLALELVGDFLSELTRRGYVVQADTGEQWTVADRGKRSRIFLLRHIPDSLLEPHTEPTLALLLGPSLPDSVQACSTAFFDLPGRRCKNVHSSLGVRFRKFANQYWIRFNDAA